MGCAIPRERMGLPPGGPKLVLSPLGIFDFVPDSKAMRVKSISPGVTIEQIPAHPRPSTSSLRGRPR